VIDPQQAFCAEDGSLARVFGIEEIATITPARARLEDWLREFAHPEKIWLIRSEYRPGQFTGGDLDHPFAYACVPGYENDCGWSLSPAAIAGKRVITKALESAVSVRGLDEEIRALVDRGLKDIFITGFLTTSCVRKTALDLRRVLPDSVEISVVESLCGCRASKYQAKSGLGDSPYQETLRVLRSAGVHVVSDLSVDEFDHQC
jgi:nicotinamidase-related amidase